MGAVQAAVAVAGLVEEAGSRRMRCIRSVSRVRRDRCREVQVGTRSRSQLLGMAHECSRWGEVVRGAVRRPREREPRGRPWQGGGGVDRGAGEPAPGAAGYRFLPGPFIIVHERCPGGVAARVDRLEAAGFLGRHGVLPRILGRSAPPHRVSARPARVPVLQHMRDSHLQARL